MADRLVSLTVVPAEDSDAEELAELTGKLRTHLLGAELNLHDVRTVRDGGAPLGSKPGDVITVGALAVTLAPLALRSLLHTLEIWMKNRPVRGIKVHVNGYMLKLDHASKTEQKQVIDEFLAHFNQGHEPE